MKLQVSTNIKLGLTELDRLDPVTIYLENFEPGRGRITITCFRKSWSASWSAMSGRTVEQFFVSCDDEYLAGNLSSCRSHVPITDMGELGESLRGKIIQQRRCGELEKGDALKFWNEADSVTLTNDFCSNTELMEAVLGEEWWMDLPEKENPDYTHLIRVIQAVRVGLSQYISQGQEAA
ncbi:UNVERIFIED_CONTAM: hypothetical protein MT382_08670 [Aeromonas salmonicida]